MITLLQPISDSATTIAVTPDPLLPQDSGLILIGSEQITYTTVYMNTLYGCVRGANSTTPASHAAGSLVTILSFFVANSAGDVTGVHADSNSDITGSVQLVSGTNVTLTQVGQAITIAASGGGGGTIPSSDVQGTTTNDDAPSGFIGEYVESVVSTATPYPGASDTYNDLTSITLSAGDWDLSLFFIVAATGATFGPTDFDYGISTSSGNAFADAMLSKNFSFDEGWVPPTFIRISFEIPSYRVSIASPTTYYAKLFISSFSVATPSYYCTLRARRIR